MTFDKETIRLIVEFLIAPLAAWIYHVGNRVTKVETKVELWWRGLELESGKLLHQPHPDAAELDRLIEKCARGPLCAKDSARYMELLALIENDKSQSMERRWIANKAILCHRSLIGSGVYHCAGV